MGHPEEFYQMNNIPEKQNESPVVCNANPKSKSLFFVIFLLFLLIFNRNYCAILNFIFLTLNLSLALLDLKLKSHLKSILSLFLHFPLAA